MRRAFKKEVHFAFKLRVPPTSFLQTRATRENTDFPQFMYSTAPFKKTCLIFSFYNFQILPSRKKKYTKSSSSKEPTKLGLFRYVESNCGVRSGSLYMIGSTPCNYQDCYLGLKDIFLMLNKMKVIPFPSLKASRAIKASKIFGS